ncbi:MAG: hypothetical protein A2589_00975 [Candidatus Vogelbacteria bacterium RIFOXYD1_FULL_46_19]|uniref:Peptidase S66 n=1 Tax=Candidatus Vogelbacteria bacterium RIFOXYD1_FULL_46_19 TaxID=1802439 RepID=A0A1G2QGA7_9BACT|nr:MAG: hypothetical protein A2589_00975 [Candidatus Vogelbacteria bacterium RIFOXYD1_FULL_46_19]
MRKISKIKKGAKVAILSPSFAAPGKWPAVYEFGLKRLRENFGLIPVEFPATKKIGASKEERSKDLINAFENKNISAIITSLGGNDQVTYIKNLPKEPFIKNPKAFFGYSDNTHFMNFLWLCGIPSYYGGAVLTQFAMNGDMDEFTMRYLKYALFESGEKELKVSEVFNDVGLDWGDKNLLDKKRMYEKNDGWFWDGNNDAKGISWGGCVESIDEILRHGIKMPTLEQFEQCILFMETSEEIPSSDYVFRVYRALGERGILERVKGILIGRPKAWEFNKQQSLEERKAYRAKQREITLDVIRRYNKTAPVIQNMDFGHTDPQICLPYGKSVRINSSAKKIFAEF